MRSNGNTTMILQEFLPAFHFSERHETMVRASQDAVYDAALAVDFSRSFVIRSLLRMRELPGRLARLDFSSQGLGPSLDDFLDAGFVKLSDDPPKELVLGAVGKFWTATPQFLEVSPEDFKSFDRPGFVKVAFNILIHERNGGHCLLSTESRILCLDDKSRNRFRCYWALIRPFSGLIRRVMLRLIRNAAEASEK
jgi:hypothetical protein